MGITHELSRILAGMKTDSRDHRSWTEQLREARAIMEEIHGVPCEDFRQEKYFPKEKKDGEEENIFADDEESTWRLVSKPDAHPGSTCDVCEWPMSMHPQRQRRDS